MKTISLILFVCTGNLCRSPMAEGILRALLAERGVGGVDVMSAGTHGVVGRGADRIAATVCLKRGIDICGHVARALDEGMLRQSDLVVVMEEEHAEWVADLLPEAAEKTRLLTSFSGGEEGGFIADPYGLPEWAHEACLRKIEKNVRGLFHALFKGEQEKG